MKLVRHLNARTLVAFVCLALAASATSLAQGRGGGPPGGGGPGGPGGGGMGGPQMRGGGVGTPNRGGMENPGFGNLPNQQRPQGPISDGRAGLQLGPPGRWWDDHGFAKNLKLRPDQQTRMDTIFEQNRNSLIASYQNVQQAQTQLQELSKSSSPDESALFAQIDRVAQARAELEKTTTQDVYKRQA